MIFLILIFVSVLANKKVGLRSDERESALVNLGRFQIMNIDGRVILRRHNI